MNASQSTTDDGSRISAHFLNTSPKSAVLVRFDTASDVNTGLHKKAGEAAAAYLQDLTASRSAFLSKLDSSAANTDAELDDAASAYLSLLLGLVNSYSEANITGDLDQETGTFGKVSIVRQTAYVPF